jgi:hypothetical protein
VTISPNQNPGSLPVQYKAPPVSIPLFNPLTHRAKATVDHPGDAVYSGAITLGTRLNPKIIYVGGKLEISGTVTGYGVFIVQGDIEVKGNVLVNPVDPLHSKLGLYTAGKTMINTEGSVVHAQILSMNEVSINAKNAQIWGSIVTKNKCTLNAEGIKVYYKPAESALTTPFWLKLTKRLVARHHYE